MVRLKTHTIIDESQERRAIIRRVRAAAELARRYQRSMALLTLGDELITLDQES